MALIAQRANVTLRAMALGMAPRAKSAKAWVVGSVIHAYLSRRAPARAAAFRWLRRRRGGHRQVELFHDVGDPHSYLVAQLVARLARRFPVDVLVVPVPPPAEDVAPEPNLRRPHAVRDAVELSHHLDVELPDPVVQPPADMLERARGILVSMPPSAQAIDAAVGLSAALWAGDWEQLSEWEARAGRRGAGDTKAGLGRGAAAERRRGHYASGVVFYEGECYVGVDRVELLAERLRIEGCGIEGSGAADALVASRPPAEWPIYEGLAPSGQLELEVFFSFRSPYSYIGLERAVSLSSRYDIALRLRPVLPMVMRGLPVPRIKRMALVHDAKMQADDMGIPFGRIVDPLGHGVERCLAVFEHASSRGAEVDYSLSAMRGIWSEGVDVSTDEGLRQVSERAGLSFSDARAALSNGAWKARVEENRQTLFSLGLWGVPSFRLGAHAWWGQDRLWIVERALRGSPA